MTATATANTTATAATTAIFSDARVCSLRDCPGAHAGLCTGLSLGEQAGSLLWLRLGDRA